MTELSQIMIEKFQNLQMFQTLTIPINKEITRVPGGYILKTWMKNNDFKPMNEQFQISISTVYVPFKFNDEIQKVEFD